MVDHDSQTLKELDSLLGRQVKVYRGLLNVIRQEREILISADLGPLEDNRKTKEGLLGDLKVLEKNRLQCVSQLVDEIGLVREDSSFRLLTLANHFGEEVGQRFRHLHSVLSLLMERVHKLNKKNEVLIQSALENINGAMGSVKDILRDSSTYKKEGRVSGSPASSGQLVSREA